MLNRREFLALLAALPAFAETTRRDAPYLGLKKFIEPGLDEFPMEKRANEVRRILQTQPHDWGKVRRAQFFPLPDGIIRYEAATEKDGQLLYRVGHWRCDWESGKPLAFSPLDEQITSAAKPYFRDVTAAFLSDDKQLSRGIPYWRSRLDPASGIDIYGSNGIAVGDIDNDGVDEIYICQPGGLPNRLFKFREDGHAGRHHRSLGRWFLDDTSCALFLDLRNTGRQDLVVLRANGPVLLMNDGHGDSVCAPTLFDSRRLPQGGFTGMAAADFDRDGKRRSVSVHATCISRAKRSTPTRRRITMRRTVRRIFCFATACSRMVAAFLKMLQPNPGINENNNRFSFAPAWCDYERRRLAGSLCGERFRPQESLRESGRPFRRRCRGGGRGRYWTRHERFVVRLRWRWPARSVRLEYVDRRRAACDSRSAVSCPRARTMPTPIDATPMGNSLYRNRGDGTFEDVTAREAAALGAGLGAAEGHDFDNDGPPEIFVTCGMLTNRVRNGPE